MKIARRRGLYDSAHPVVTSRAYRATSFIEEKEKLIHLLKVGYKANTCLSQEATGERAIPCRGGMKIMIRHMLKSRL